LYIIIKLIEKYFGKHISLELKDLPELDLLSKFSKDGL